MRTLEYYLNQSMDFLAYYIPKVFLALVTLIIGFWVIKYITRLAEKALDKNNIDVSLRGFLSGLISMLLKVMLVVSVISMVGIETTSFVAVLAAAGFAIGLALQGSLGNFAGGVLLLIFKPFKAGDFIEAQGYSGTVNSIQIFNTVLKTPDNKTIIIPNGAMSSGPVVNYSTEELRRVDFVFGIGYSDDVSLAKQTLNDLIAADERILKEPVHQVVVSELADSSVNFTVRVWVNAADYWGVFFDMQENVKFKFDEKGISIPFPQTDVHLIKENN